MAQFTNKTQIDAELQSLLPAKASTIRKINENIIAVFEGQPSNENITKIKSGAFESAQAGTSQKVAECEVFSHDTNNSYQLIKSFTPTVLGTYTVVLTIAMQNPFPESVNDVDLRLLRGSTNLGSIGISDPSMDGFREYKASFNITVTSLNDALRFEYRDNEGGDNIKPVFKMKGEIYRGNPTAGYFI